MNKSMNMSRRQKALQQSIDELLEICRLRGIGSQNLKQSVVDVCTDGIWEDTPAFQRAADRADTISAAGLTAQIALLREAWGLTKLTRVLNEMGGILDAIVRQTSSDPNELAEDIGRDSINADGDLI